MTGIILLDKPKGITSFLALAKVRRIVSEKKAGHTGTLDPMATGVLPVLLGGATRFCELLPSHEKTYRAAFSLGIKTDTLDIKGKVLKTRRVNAKAVDVIQALKAFEGEIEQTPPMFSAVMKDGVRLYELARRGIEIEREKRKAVIFSIELFRFNEERAEYEINVRCSAGTYIRSLVDDLGEKLGCGAVLTELERTQANGFGIEQCISLEELEKTAAQGNIQSILIPVEKALSAYPSVSVTQAQAVRFKNGGELDLKRLDINSLNGFYNVFSPEGQFLGLGERREGSESFTVKRVFVPR
ncbi:MAG: tRNA pseudouridine(55) synthase TruB [Clostridiales bacterium]|nr:tRNA pseudouridine(55) synthase TruB [Clostridiales bacterium]